MRTSSLKLVLVNAAIVAALACFADIRYTVRYDASASKLFVAVKIPVKDPTTSVQIPNWAPGAYILANYRDRIKDMAAADDSGKSLEISKPDSNTWSVQTNSQKAVIFTYNLDMSIVDNVVHYSGPSTYVYVVGRKTERCLLEISPPGKGMIAIGLNAVKNAQNTFTAKDYDVLADNPVTMGDFVLDEYTFRGKRHEIAYRGAGSKYVDRGKVISMLDFLTKAQIDFFKGQMPYGKYVWHFSVNDAPDGAGGLEHLSSTQIGMGAGAGPGVQHVWSHEFFHLWNVKRIRSLPLGPFDYLQLPKTGALWWLEGVTDYYSNIIPFRYGLWTESKFLSDLLDNYNQAMRNNARKEISIYDSSYRVGEANNGRGNSSGLRINYYTFGWLAGMCLDVEIRFQTQGKKSLDDVMWILWNSCKNDKPGFAEDAIRKACVEVGGAALGPYYDRVIMTPGDPPIPEQLEKMGLKIETVTEKFLDRGFDWTPARTENGARVTGVRASAEGQLQRGDIVLELEGFGIGSESFAKMFEQMTKSLQNLKIGKPFNVKIRRGEETKTVIITPVESERQVQRVTEAQTATDMQRNLRKGWYFAGKKPIPLLPSSKEINRS